MNKSLNILVCDINIVKGGHYISHSQYILDHVEQLESENPGIHFSFLYNKQAAELLKFSDFTRDKAHFLDDEHAPTNGVKPRNDIVKKIQQFCRQHRIDHM
ncbi:MAG TPA: hypothetical protein VLC28_06265, partial [Flavitalea sp.]|nr:hypothetical protein [Flavitalea sp.]